MTDEAEDQFLRALQADARGFRDDEAFTASVMEKVRRERVRARERVQIALAGLAALTFSFALSQIELMGEALARGFADMLPVLPADPTDMTLLAALLLSAGAYLLAEKA